jgi:hypothetical protein
VTNLLYNRIAAMGELQLWLSVTSLDRLGWGYDMFSPIELPSKWGLMRSLMARVPYALAPWHVPLPILSRCTQFWNNISLLHWLKTLNREFIAHAAQQHDCVFVKSRGLKRIPAV